VNTHTYQDSAGRKWPALIDDRTKQTVEGVTWARFCTFEPMPMVKTLRIVPKNRPANESAYKL